MTTTDTVTARSGHRFTGSRPLVAAALVTLGVGLLLALVAAVADGSAAAYGALVGTAITVGVFSLGAFAVDAVARLMPAVSLLFALLTYTLQVLVMALVLVGFERSGLLDSTLDRRWIAGAIIVGVLVWTAVQVRVATTARIPAYDANEKDLPDATAEGGGPAAEGGAR